MLESCKIEERSVDTRIRILPNADNDLRGRNNLNVLRPETLEKLGSADSNPVITTTKSSQFQASLR